MPQGRKRSRTEKAAKKARTSTKRRAGPKNSARGGAHKSAKAGARKSATARKKMAPMTAQIRKTAAKVLAGAAAGAVRAIIPPLEKAADKSAEAAGTKKRS